MLGLHDLTNAQKQAVTHVDGPLLVLAGPGSGKTRVITRRVAHLVHHGISPWEILAITFTNKAAREMGERVQQLLPGTRVWVSTFHRFCARILRQHSAALGLRPNYTIFDTSDQRQLLRGVMSDLDLSTTHFPPHKIGARISRLKNELVSAEEFVRRHDELVGTHYEAVVAQVYPAYQRALLDANAVDFDDLLLHVVRLFEECPEVRSELDRRFRYVLVDEYQDTNLAQYLIVRALSQEVRNLCATGDPDQSIYGWRGARLDNILRFEQDFADARVIRLEENFRSTKEILRAADSLIRHNVHRKHKELHTRNDEGSPVALLCYSDERDEADAIAERIRRSVEAGERGWADFAVCFRVNALSRVLERALTRHNIPYQVASGVAFYERAEIKDVLAYLRLVHNPRDVSAFQRVVNTPVRGIGKTSQNRLIAWAREQQIDLLEACFTAASIPKFSKRAVYAARRFGEILRGLADEHPDRIEALLRALLDRSGYLDQWKYSDLEDDQQRVANVEELLTAARQFDRAFDEFTEDDADRNATPLQRFLEVTSLASEADSLDDASGRVSLMTLHSAKGLEFPVVFILAVEQNLLPHERSLAEGSLKELEEERRLLFVGMTRAKHELYLTRTAQRDFRGRPLSTVTSQFLNEMDLDVRQESVAGSAEAHLEWKHLLDQTRRERDAPAPLPALSSSLPPGLALPKLMTGAELLQQQTAAPGRNSGFEVGNRVRHPRLGIGTITRVDGVGPKRRVTVCFEDDDQTETYVLSKCPLQPAG